MPGRLERTCFTAESALVSAERRAVAGEDAEILNFDLCSAVSAVSALSSVLVAGLGFNVRSRTL